jgi:hypothetical protein
MPEIPISVIDKNTWNILPGKINTKDPPDKSHHLLILLLRKGMIESSNQIMSNYILNYKECIIRLFKQKNIPISHITNNIKLAIYEYIGHKRKNDAIVVMKHFGIHFNYTIFRCSIKADNYALVSLLVRKGYPYNIKKHNDEIYHIMNDMLNMTIMSESTFEILIDNILSAYKKAKISLFTYIRILKKGYYKTCKKIKPFVDENIWNGEELRLELIDLRDNWNHLYSHMIEHFHLAVMHKR